MYIYLHTHTHTHAHAHTHAAAPRPPPHGKNHPEGPAKAAPDTEHQQTPERTHKAPRRRRGGPDARPVRKKSNPTTDHRPDGPPSQPTAQGNATPRTIQPRRDGGSGRPGRLRCDSPGQTTNASYKSAEPIGHKPKPFFVLWYTTEPSSSRGHAEHPGSSPAS